MVSQQLSNMAQDFLSQPDKIMLILGGIFGLLAAYYGVLTSVLLSGAGVRVRGQCFILCACVFGCQCSDRLFSSCASGCRRGWADPRLCAKHLIRCSRCLPSSASGLVRIQIHKCLDLSPYYDAINPHPHAHTQHT